MSPTRLSGTTGRCPRDGSSSPNDHADAIDGVVTPSSVCHLWLPKSLDRSFWSPSAPGTLPTQTAEGRRASRKLRFQVIANNLGVAAGISLTGHDDDLIRRGERPIVAPEHFDQLEYRYPASRILDRRKLGYSDGCRQDHFLPKNTDEILSLLIIK